MDLDIGSNSTSTLYTSYHTLVYTDADDLSDKEMDTKENMLDETQPVGASAAKTGLLLP